MLDSIANILHQECGLQETDLLLVGFSGGPDSLCLLHLLHGLGYRVVAAHLNHKLRPQADEESHIVGQLARQTGVDFVAGEQDVPAYAKSHALSVEEAARQLRYRFLFDQAESYSAHAVVVAHTADDQVETILMHILRGTGLNGLGGMPLASLPNAWSEHVPLVRPLLHTWRWEVLEYLAEQGLTPLTDESNADTTYLRNRIRHELLPTLEGYNPGIRQSLLRLGQIVREDQAVITAVVQQAREKALAQQGAASPVFKRVEFLRLEPSIQRVLLREMIGSHLPGLVDVDFACIERGRLFVAEGKAHAQVDLVGGLVLVTDGSLFSVATGGAEFRSSQYPILASMDELELSTHGEVQLNGEWRLEAQVVPESELERARQVSLTNEDPYQAWLDRGALTTRLVVRRRRRGERMQPLGLGGHTVKISDVMVNLKLPRQARDSWPLVCSSGDIVWMPGYRQSEATRVGPETRQIIHIQLSRTSGSIFPKD